MPRLPDSGHFYLAEVFYYVQKEMQAQLALGSQFEHPTASGAAAEQVWLNALTRYLPKRYTAAPAFVIDSHGRRSRQIDIAIFDNLYSPLLFPHASGLHVPAESVHAVFEVKQSVSRQSIADAQKKASSVHALRRYPVRVLSGHTLKTVRAEPILTGLLATTSIWTPGTFKKNLRAIPHHLDIGCALEHGSFERNKNLTISTPEESLIYFILRLLERLRAQGTAPAPDLMKYARNLASLKPIRPSA
jgi:hypothetical protein